LESIFLEAKFHDGAKCGTSLLVLLTAASGQWEMEASFVSGQLCSDASLSSNWVSIYSISVVLEKKLLGLEVCKLHLDIILEKKITGAGTCELQVHL
jgi:hypothetical protein